MAQCEEKAIELVSLGDASVDLRDASPASPPDDEKERVCDFKQLCFGSETLDDDLISDEE